MSVVIWIDSEKPVVAQLFPRNAFLSVNPRMKLVPIFDKAWLLCLNLVIKCNRISRYNELTCDKEFSSL